MLLVAVSSAQTVPAGWKVIKDKKQLCQIAVPSDWIQDKIMTSMVNAPDNKANIVMSPKPADATFKDISDMAKSMFKPAKSFDSSANRIWFEEAATPGHKGSAWYAVINTSPVCEVQVEFQNPAFEADAKKIVESLSKVK
jgi:hypothetical protein